MAAGGLAERVLAGDVRAASRLMRQIEDGRPSAIPELQALFPRTGRAYVIGVTGAPGVGKSTLTDRLIARARRAGQTVGVLAVDPTSPFSGGALLGDRVRMQEHATDAGVFVRSLATRGHLGGLSRATGDCVRVMEALGLDTVLVETVGVGQDELEIAQLAHTTVVVLVPGMGDEVQASKAGILEIADLFVVNKADREGAERTLRELRQMLELRYAAGTPARQGEAGRLFGLHPRSAGWEPPILTSVASEDRGLDALMEALGRHRAFLETSGEREERDRWRAGSQLLSSLRERLLDSALERLAREEGRLEDLVAGIAARRADPYALAEQLARELAG